MYRLAKKADVSAVTSSPKPRNQPKSMNQENREPALVAVAMASYLRRQSDDRVDLQPCMPKMRNETVIEATSGGRICQRA